jgi:peptidoglycan/LPS O-acetylase OafA/YrhL
MFGFGVGLLLYRRLDKIHANFIQKFPMIAVLVLTLVLSSPSLNAFNAIFDLAAVFIVFPFCVLAMLADAPKTYKSLLLSLGSASYPIYVFHFPAGQIVELLSRGYVNRLAPFSGILFIVLIFVFSVYLERFIDIPVRKFLTKKYSSK